jgi:hypothetical protein
MPAQTGSQSFYVELFTPTEATWFPASAGKMAMK